MRTTKRFTPAVLERFAREGRGLGIFEDYSGWHKVTRGDPTSEGRSHIMTLSGRPHDFLSDLERNTALFAWMNLRLVDLREQFPLSLEPSVHELAAYGAASYWKTYPGTLQIAKDLSIRHPSITGDGRKTPWVMSTDQLLTIRSTDGRLIAIALCCKYHKDILSKRKRQLLAIERAYWMARGVRWMLITERLSNPYVIDNLVRTWHWGLISSPTQQHMHYAMEVGRALEGHPIHTTLHRLADKLGSLALAQDAFWRAVWTGRLPMQLLTGWRPSDRLRLVGPRDFWLQNPVVAGRCAWTN